MKKIACFLLMLLLIIVPIVSSYATEEIIIEEKQVNTVTVKAKVLEAEDVYEETIDNILEKKQKVKIEILEGEYQGKEFEATYILSYDIDNKILAHELEKGNKVFVRH